MSPFAEALKRPYVSAAQSVGGERGRGQGKGWEKWRVLPLKEVHSLESRVEKG